MGLFKSKNKARAEKEPSKVELVTFTEPKNVISEQIRTVRTNIEFSAAGIDDFKLMMLTSPEIGDGKSTVAANLAVAWAQAGKRTLLVDTDLRRPTVHLSFYLDNQHGLSTLLVRDEQPKEVIKGTFVPGLSVLTSGPVPPNPAELLASSKMGDLMHWMRENFDVVLFDAPPVIAVSDAQVLMPRVDGVALVVTMNKTLKSNLNRTVEILQLSENTKILGAIERVKDKRSDDGYGYGYGYGYGDN
ncbi:capsular exopolysaccharide synthesis family protein [Weissella uvarum]|uniref:CpsD/CapB family tyrosine-protein kinase n=1 Tax=Weissella uvarum TaxID=1479233 RepID=UPI00195FCFA4|nr:CpsD/CapB family tyrosine-protein kinase [Weissella uvarum]MBM7617696.1 capsular exopolysaccharide synthesis family protein [Weissella uvarum]MCM0596045.1 CpsD/CapB family tyrosine-protein kinase [Weissella uvarum]